MPDISKTRLARISRRSLLLEGIVCAGGAATMLAAADVQSAQAAKISQGVVKYQDSPKGEQMCSNCKLFTAPNACQTVDGTISPNGWCMIYQKA
jgi:High potential iron-sulfur protein